MDVGSWDAVVVGAGTGGLVCAAYLATSGMRVLVVEQHDVAGGNSHVFRRRRAYEFDVGVHYLGDCGPDGVLPSILSGVGLADRVRFREMDPDGYDRIVLPGVELDVPADSTALRARLIRAFPGDAEAIDRFLGVSGPIGAGLRESLLSETEPSPLELARRAPGLPRWANRPLTELFDHCGLSAPARTVLSAQTLNFGMGPDQISVGMHASVTDHYLRGSYYPVGGSQTIAASLVETLEAHGGVLRTRSRVARILVERGRTTGVELAGGERIEAPLVVSNADFPRTVLELVGQEHFPASVVAKTRDVEMALPLAVGYFGLATDLAHRRNANLLWHREDDIAKSYDRLATGDWDELPVLFLSFASLKDPDSPAVCPPGHSNFQLLALCPPGYRPWGVADGPSSGTRYRRNPDYRVAKDRLTEAMVRGAEAALGPFREHLTHLEVATPLTQERYTRSTGGVSFGMTRWGGRIVRPDIRTAVEGLYVVGQSTKYGTGIGGVAVSGIACAGEVLGRRLLPEVHRGAVFADRDLLPERRADWDPLRVSRGTARRGARGLAGRGGRAR